MMVESETDYEKRRKQRGNNQCHRVGWESGEVYIHIGNAGTRSAA